MKADLHIHSIASSDGALSPLEITRKMKELGFGAIAVLDHNTIKGSLTAAAYAKEQEIIVVRGVEISSSEGHIGALGIGEIVERDLSPEETVERIHDLGGIAVALHPFRWRSGIGAKAVRRCRFDAVEVLNGRTSPVGNKKAKILCESLQLPVTAGSDSHMEFELGRSYLTMEKCETEEQLIESIIKGMVKVEGEGRSIPDTIKYANKTIGEWVRRGFKRI